MITQVEIAHRVGLDVSSVNKILNRRSGPVFRKETIKKVFKIAKDMGYDFGRLKYAHRRRFVRKDISLGAEIYVYHKDGSLYDQGVAHQQLSPSAFMLQHHSPSLDAAIIALAGPA